MLSDRRQQVLAALIEEYVARALPVGSRTLAERYGFDVSPATIRNDLSALEDAGFISQPHTSAGRIPTDLGYRAFVDRLEESGALDTGDGALPLLESLRQTADELDDLLERTSRALSRFTDCLTVVAPPDFTHPKLLGLMALMRQPEFVQTESLLPIMQMLEDDVALLHFLDSTAPEDSEPQVRIGHENNTEELKGVSVVACRYGMGPTGGIVAVIGPTRMDYTKALAAVRVASKTLGAAPSDTDKGRR